MANAGIGQAARFWGVWPEMAWAGLQDQRFAVCWAELKETSPHQTTNGCLTPNSFI